MTLVEVVAGLALLGTLLVTLLTAKIGLMRQRVEAEKRLAAIRVADELLSGWQAEAHAVPRNASGVAGVNDEFRWRTRGVRTERIDNLAFEVVRLELTANMDRQDEFAPKTLAAVELMLATEDGGS